MSETVSIPFPRRLYDDIVRFSDGRADPVFLAATMVEQWVATSVDPDMGGDPEVWGDRVEDVVEQYAPDQARRWKTALGESAVIPTSPLVWKEIMVPNGSDVRMEYKGKLHFAKVVNGKIVDGGKPFSPNRWASKITGTARDAWRDLWFREPRSSEWTPAHLLRDRVRAIHRGGDTN